MDKIVLIDKPKGITSYDVIRVLKRHYPKGTKLGHAGTLDPNASGLLIVGVGHGTKSLAQYVGMNKVYHAEVLLGLSTTTGDIEGEVTQNTKVSPPLLTGITKAIKQIQGKHILPVSKYSATKIAGIPAYKHARLGNQIPNLKREMEVLESKLINHAPFESHYILSLELTVTSGTYIRSIAEEIGRLLDLPATLYELRRTAIGPFKIEEAVPLTSF